MRRFLPILCVIAVMMLSAPVASAAPGDLDTSFGSGGWIATDLGGAGAISMAVGKGIVVLARDSALYVVRYQLNGSLDTTFSHDGVVQVPFHGFVADMVVDSHERSLVMADAGKGPTLGRFLPNGTIDRTFGDAGSVIVPGDFFLRSVALQTDGKILLVGEGSGNVVILRLGTGGALDRSFGDGGLVRIDLGTVNDFGWHVATLPTHKILVLASRDNCDSDGNCRVKGVLIRLNADGSEDMSFGSGGQVRWRFKDFDPIDMAVGPRGRVVVLMSQFGVFGCPSGGHGLVAFRSNGAVAVSFGDHGRVAPLPIEPTDLVEQPDGRIVISGTYCPTTSQMDFGVMRILPSGLMDGTFGQNGLSAPRLGTFDSLATAMSLQTDGNIVLAGSMDSNGIESVDVARYLAA